MSQAATDPLFKSRMVHGKLTPRPGSSHLMIADATGAEALLELAKSAPDGFMAQAHVVYIPKDTGEKYTAQLEKLAPAQIYVGPSYEAAVSRLRRVLQRAHMGLQVYLAGTESLIGQAMAEATGVGIPHSAIQTEHRGSTARRMQCVHCKGITENVTHDPFQCSHCGLHLFVRDHYSRRLAAFQGVRVDAEDPGNIPQPVERFK